MTSTSPQPARSAGWPILLLAAPAFVAIWSGWVGLGTLTGFGVIHPLPGTPLDGLTIDTRITLPVGVETYAAYALSVWYRYGEVSERARRFARASAVGSLILGAGGQVAYHLMVAAGISRAPWPITAAVSCLPVAVLGMGVTLGHMLRHGQPAAEPEAAPVLADPEGARLVTAARTARAAIDALKARPVDLPAVGDPGSDLGADEPVRPAAPRKPAQQKPRPVPAGRDVHADARAVLDTHPQGRPLPGYRTLAADHGWPDRHARAVASHLRDFTAADTEPARLHAVQEGH